MPARYADLVDYIIDVTKEESCRGLEDVVLPRLKASLPKGKTRMLTDSLTVEDLGFSEDGTHIGCAIYSAGEVVRKPRQRIRRTRGGTSRQVSVLSPGVYGYVNRDIRNIWENTLQSTKYRLHSEIQNKMRRRI